MAGICFYFEETDVDVWSGKNLDAWNYAAQASGDIDRMIVVNRTNTVVRSPNTDLVSFEVVTNLPELQNAVYCVAPNERRSDTIELWGFDHNVEWYCFGPASGWPTPPLFTLTVPQANVGALHAVHIASVVLLHRFAIKRS